MQALFPVQLPTVTNGCTCAHIYIVLAAGNSISILPLNCLISKSAGFIVANASLGLYGVSEYQEADTYHTSRIGLANVFA
jgi:hypothetical protein